MPINAVLDNAEETPLYGYTEPVSVEEFKHYAKIDFNDDDDLIALLLVSSREDLEKYLGVSIVQKVLTAIVCNEDGGIEIPYGPTPGTVDVTTILDIDGNAIDEGLILITGINFKQLQTPCYPYVRLMYTAGYVTTQQSLTEGGVPLPEAIRMAIKAETFFRYENRGSRAGYQSGIKDYSQSYIAEASKQFCNKYKRNTELSL